MGIENIQQAPGSQCWGETLNPQQAYLQNGQLPGSQRVDRGSFCFKTVRVPAQPNSAAPHVQLGSWEPSPTQAGETLPSTQEYLDAR